MPGENTLISQDARVTGRSSAQHRLVSIAAPPDGFPSNTSARISGQHSDTATPAFARSPRAPSPPVAKFQGATPATGVCASPLSLGRRACAPSAAPPNHEPRSSQPAAPARRSFQRGCPTPPPPYHAVAVGLRCGKADTEAPRSRMKLDSAFPRNSGGRSTLFPAKEEWTR